MADERGLGGHLEGSDGSWRAGDEVGEIGGGDSLPGADAVGDEAYEVRGGDEDHALARPDDGGLDEEQDRPGDADVTEAVEREENPVLEFGEDGPLREAGNEAAEWGFEEAGPEEEGEDPSDRDDEGKLGEKLEVRRDARAHGEDEEKNEHEDVE